MNKYQIERADNFDKFVLKYFPQWDCPAWFVKILDKILPNHCIFNKAIFYKGFLIIYIPSLCQLNPFFDRLIEYRGYKK